MTRADQSAFITKQTATRRVLQAKITELQLSRTRYIADNAAAPAEDSFDASVFRALKAAAEKRGIKYTDPNPAENPSAPNAH